MFNFKGAIVDLDGTIIDSMGIWEKIDIKFFEEINIPMPSDYIKIINNMRNSFSTPSITTKSTGKFFSMSCSKYRGC